MAVRLEDLPPQIREQIAGKQLKETKYRNKKTPRMLANGVTIMFDSQKEALRYDELRLLLKAGRIRDLKLQVEFTVREAYTTAEGYRVRAIRYVADFTYDELLNPNRPSYELPVWRYVVEDVKTPGTKTRTYEMKKKLFIEKNQMQIREV